MRFTQIDAFAERAFQGNPAAVLLLNEYPESRQMQLVAKEMNLSETAFLRPAKDGYELRWFTPTVEVDLCGHATLAAAHYLWEAGEVEKGATARFHTRSGLLTAVARHGWIEMNFPAQPAVACEPPPGLLQATGVDPKFVGRNESDWLIEVGSAQEVRDLNPDVQSLSEICDRGLMVTARSDADRFDFVSRFFAPAVGVAEDPVTGSAHCCLGPYWSGRLGRAELVGWQASNRGGVVRTRVEGEQVILGGQAITVLRGELAVPWPGAL